MARLGGRGNPLLRDRSLQQPATVAGGAAAVASTAQMFKMEPLADPAGARRSRPAMEFGVFDHLDRCGPSLADYYEDRLKIAEAYDRAGFYAYHLAEHHSTPLGMAPSPSVFLSAVAQRTRRLRFGPLVWAMPVHHPLRLIEEICMLDQLSGGRLEIGFGRGSVPIELEYYGANPDEAQEIYAEAVELVLKGLTQKLLDFKGRHFSFHAVPMEIAPLQQPHPPIWYGVHMPESAERAARRNLNVVSLDPPRETRLSIDRYRAIWPQVHAPSVPFPKLGLGRFIVVAPSEAEALALARRAYLVWHASFTFLFRRHQRAQSHPRPETFDLLRERGQGIAGTPGAVADFLAAQLEQTRCNYVVGQFAFGDLTLRESLRSIALFADEVMPKLRRTAGESADRARAALRA
jgi:alkanesulfonate monooxygenase SsuD/methylene tetrahydromethanopterin reductase-like flavin-dependent oxidoreductase (luciferase family)